MANPSVSNQYNASHDPIYLDNLATTPVDPRVLEAVLPYLKNHFGNPSSSTHGFGWKAADAVEEAREQTAELIGARAREIVFTSGATEANNLAVKGVALAATKEQGTQIIMCATEHPSVLDCKAFLQKQGFEIVVLPVDRYGVLDPDELREKISDHTLLISVMAANNELGTVHRLKEIGEVASETGVLWHCDAAQAAGKIPLDVDSFGIDLLSLSAHKLYAPKGQGALYVRSNRRPRLRISPQLEGGGQERGLRSGTTNVAGAAGLGKACEIARMEMAVEAERVGSLCAGLKRRFQAIETASFNGHPTLRLPGCLSVTIKNLDSGALMMALRDKVAISAGSACKSGFGAASHVLEAIGLDATSVAGTLRFGLGRFTKEKDVEIAWKHLSNALSCHTGPITNKIEN